MAKKLNKAIDDIISVIKQSNDYKMCLELKEKLNKSEDVIKLVEEIKQLQKEYVKTQDNKIKKVLDDKTTKLEKIPIYHVYMKHLEAVNLMIETVKDELNNYFNNLLNGETTFD